MSYRPITDVWILARPKVPYYGAYPSGFLSRARELLGVHEHDPVLHVCGGMANKYPFRGFGINDSTLDIHSELSPDFVHDVRKPLPMMMHNGNPWPAIIADPPYTVEDAKEYNTENSFPDPSKLLRNCLDAVRPGGRVGFLHYIWPRPPKTARSIAAVGVVVGFGNRIRIYSVFERMN